MDTGLLAQKFGVGLAMGLGIVGGIAAVFTPASFFMNRHLSHHWTLRALHGIASICLFPIAWIAMFAISKRVHYTGMFPVIDAAGYSGWIATLLHPFLMTFNEGAYKRAIDIWKGVPKSPYVSEPLVLGAAAAGAMANSGAWTNAMATLESLVQKNRVASAEGLGSEEEVPEAEEVPVETTTTTTTEAPEAAPAETTTTTTTTVTPVAAPAEITTTEAASVEESNPEAGTGLAYSLRQRDPSNRKLEFEATRPVGLNSSTSSSRP